MYKICVYVPEAAIDAVKQALFAAGAGRIGLYDQCCWQVRGEGQFRPLPGSEPAIGEQQRVETVVEYKLELVCEADCLAQAIEAMCAAHPYEEPAFQYWAVNPDAALDS